MDYLKHYTRLVERARNRVLDGYKEQHHILPKCLGGTDELSNLVYLTAEEHFVAHQLLVKVYPKEPKLIYAVIRMSHNAYGRRPNNKLYSWMRIKHSKTHSELVKFQYKTHANYGMTNKKHSAETRHKMSLAHRGPAPKITCPTCGVTGGVNNMRRYHFENCGKAIEQLQCPHCSKTAPKNIIKRWHFDNCKHRVSSL